jgi:hypothetical protein
MKAKIKPRRRATESAKTKADLYALLLQSGQFIKWTPPRTQYRPDLLS